MTKDNNCALCGDKLEQRGKPTKEYEVKQFGKMMRKVCKTHLTNSTTPTTQEERKK